MNKVIINGVEYAPIGKPRPLLADAKVGDLCKRRDGKYVQIIRIDTCHKRPYRYRDNEYGGDERGVTVAGSWICDDNGKRSFDIIATEPLAPEGTAEWAWQMLILQKPVSHPAEGIWLDTYYSKDGFVRCMAKTGWQLYEPDHDFNVGDWVEYEYSDGTLQQAIIEAYSGQPGEQMVYVWHPQTAHSAKTPLQSITRKLTPSEIVLDFGNGIKGRIRNVGDGWIWIRDNESLNNIATIDTAKLTEPMQTTVRKLLAAIEEERKKQ